jgi:hypothetical protein
VDPIRICLIIDILIPDIPIAGLKMIFFMWGVSCRSKRRAREGIGGEEVRGMKLGVGGRREWKNEGIVHLHG